MYGKSYLEMEKMGLREAPCQAISAKLKGIGVTVNSQVRSGRYQGTLLKSWGGANPGIHLTRMMILTKRCGRECKIAILFSC